jgi:mRNA export factor
MSWGNRPSGGAGGGYGGGAGGGGSYGAGGGGGTGGGGWAGGGGGGGGGGGPPPVGGPGANTVGNNDNDFMLPDGPAGIISGVKWTPNNCVNLMVSATSWDKTVRVWGVQTQVSNGLVSAVNAQGLGMKTSEYPILSSDFAQNGTCFYGGCDRTAMMWDLQADTVTQVAAHDAPVCCVRYQEEGAAGQMLVTSGWDGKVRFWDLRSPNPVKEENFGAPVHHMDLSTAPLATFLCGRKVVVYNLQTMTKSHDAEPVAKASYAMRRVANLKDQSGVYACTVDGRVVSLPLAPQQQSEQFKAHGGADPRNAKLFDAYQVNFILAHPTNKTLITGASDGLIRCFDVVAKGRFYEFAPKLFQNTPIPAAAGDLSADGTMLAYALSYDWSLGKDGYNDAMPQGVFIKPLAQAHIR